MTEEIIFYLKRGNFRQALFLELQVPRTTRELSRLLGKSNSQVHQSLGELASENLVVVIKGKKGRGKAYKYTAFGEAVARVVMARDKMVGYNQALETLQRVKELLEKGEHEEAKKLLKELLE